ncbi:MAG: hypothetical protein IT363_04705 [Methanoregulaceae archaeon]|nr:hypothetical protein [Methanoregulaceae archaeon]
MDGSAIKPPDGDNRNDSLGRDGHADHTPRKHGVRRSLMEAPRSGIRGQVIVACVLWMSAIER